MLHGLKRRPFSHATYSMNSYLFLSMAPLQSQKTFLCLFCFSGYNSFLPPPPPPPPLPLLLSSYYTCPSPPNSVYHIPQFFGAVLRSLNSRPVRLRALLISHGPSLAADGVGRASRRQELAIRSDIKSNTRRSGPYLRAGRAPDFPPWRSPSCPRS